MRARQLDFRAAEQKLAANGYIELNKVQFIRILEECIEERDLGALRRRIADLKQEILAPRGSQSSLLTSDRNSDTAPFRQDILESDLDQITDSQTVERAHYYVSRLKAGAERIRTGKINDINLLRWKEYDDVLTDSLWIVDRRDNAGVHRADYWGNFIPQIPRQMMLRYTKKGEWVLDTFVGSGTTLIECRRLGRNGIGIELNPAVADSARKLVNQEPNEGGVTTDIVEGDSTTLDFTALLQQRGVGTVQLLIMHPPYHDIIRFSDHPRDLSTAGSVDEFLAGFGQVVEKSYPILDDGRYLAVVIGDKYAEGEWIPLGFYTMQEVLRRGYTLKSVIVKNFDETRAKRQQQELWRYRALVGGFYVFKHEYILLFRKD